MVNGSRRVSAGEANTGRTGSMLEMKTVKTAKTIPDVRSIFHFNIDLLLPKLAFDPARRYLCTHYFLFLYKNSAAAATITITMTIMM